VRVANRNIATYLKFEIARRTGVLANFRFEYLYRFFRDAIVDDDIQILGRDDLHTLLLDVLYDDGLLGDPDLGAVRSYLDVATEPDARHRRVWQLGAELARVFEEYTLSRPRMLDLWPQRTVVSDERYVETERWQRRIWLELFGKHGRVRQAATRRGRRLALTPDIFAHERAVAR